MKQLRVNLGDRSYDILIGTGILDQVGSIVAKVSTSLRAIIITNPLIDVLYGEKTRQSLVNAGFRVDTIQIPEGEEHKSLTFADKAYNDLMEFNCDRSTVLVALGGGVIGDLTGFVAATYMRGIPFVQIPTTLLAQVDSSVGGKTAVNHPKGKNMIGAFYQPKVVAIDLDTLSTLPTDEFRSGLAEVVKYGVIADPDLFDYLDEHAEEILKLDSGCLSKIIETSCAIKAEVVESDEKESRRRMILNFGHTFGHAIESLTKYIQYKHGEAVAIGMVFASMLSHEMGKCTSSVGERVEGLLKKFHLPIKSPKLHSSVIIESMFHDKKNTAKKIKFILAKKVGEVEIIDEVPEAVLKKALDNFM
jgi:3-dehydroquinate synthase